MKKKDLMSLFSEKPKFKSELLNDILNDENETLYFTKDLNLWCRKDLINNEKIDVINDKICEEFLKAKGINIKSFDDIEKFIIPINGQNGYYKVPYYFDFYKFFNKLFLPIIFDLYLESLSDNDGVLDKIAKLVEEKVGYSIGGEQDNVKISRHCSCCARDAQCSCNCNGNYFTDTCAEEYLYSSRAAGLPINYFIPIELESYKKRKEMENLFELRFSGNMTKKQTVLLAGYDSCIVSDMGNRSDNQDAALIMKHPMVPEFKIIAVADGMGGMSAGDKFSAKVIEKLRNWFLEFSVSKDQYDDVNFYYVVIRALRQCIRNIDRDLKNELGDINGGTTLALAIICGERTVLLNIGDSRIYNYRPNHLRLMSQDQSLVWINESEVDKTRFSVYSHYIKNYLPGDGVNIFRSNDKYWSVNTRALDYLILCTDGASDMLNHNTIKNILTQNSDSVEGMASELVGYAVSPDNIDLINPNFGEVGYCDKLQVAKDNATVAITKVRRR